MKKDHRALSPDLQAALDAVANLTDDQIDTSEAGDAPERRGRDWSQARRGAFYRPVKTQMTLRLDSDVVAWFRDHPGAGRGYQTRINAALREYVQRHADEDADAG
jgi:uncharacterized protein (DUF4415 family)